MDDALASPEPYNPERRRDARRKISVEVAIHSPTHNTPLRATTTDLSTIGCYVEMMFTLEIGTRITLDLWINEAKLSTEAIIITRDQQVGNGIQFEKLADEDRLKLRGFLISVGASD